MLIDSHCHLDALEFNQEQDIIVKLALEHGVEKIIVPAVNRKSFDDVITLRKKFPNCFYALGFHPMYINDMKDDDLDTDRKSTRLNSSHIPLSRMPSSA